ncbi:hypothetical protein EV650_5169 [Kribbella kalugense]|uniref:Uncharacterized protein n=1 Tax=Kribbella kalugense TaxID=2512221 RepID=A0A4R7ZSZ0_9ACTN|nr:hypothetical protein EV650_5169 [Kribbella kalugense]
MKTLGTLCSCPEGPLECTPDEEILTHWGRRGDFRQEPRVDREIEMSLLAGELSVKEATDYVNPMSRRNAAVRYTTAGALRAAGFAVVHTLGRVRSQKHVSIVWPPDDPLNEAKVPWPPAVVARFNECFND